MKSHERLKIASALVQRLRDAISPPPEHEMSAPEAMGIGGAGGMMGMVPGIYRDRGAHEALSGTLDFEKKWLDQMRQPLPKYVEYAEHYLPSQERMVEELGKHLRSFPEPNVASRFLRGGAVGAGLGGAGWLLYHLLHNKNASERPILRAEVVADSFLKEAIIRQEGGKYVLYSHKGKVLGRHPSRAKAIAQEQAIKAHGG